MAKVSIQQLSGWGRTTVSESLVMLPEERTDLDSIRNIEGGLGVIGRGCGRSYGDASTNKDGLVVDMTSMNRIISFDEETGIIICEAGVTVSQLVKEFLPRGIVPPVCPGTGYITVAGAVANDVHGKNHEVDGSFGDHLQWLELMLPSGETRQISEKDSPELFRATIGGAGLTGIITRVAFTMMTIDTNAVKVTEIPVQDLTHFMDALAESTRHTRYNVGWIDAVATGKHMGRGILITADAADGFHEVKKRLSVTVPVDMPGFTLNRYTVRLFNAFYFHRIGKGHTGIVDYERFVFPLDALHHWNRLYGTRGVHQFQCVIPHERAKHAIHELMRLTSQNQSASPLAVLKILGRSSHGLLSFPMPGFTLALDLPHTRNSLKLIRRMVDITLDNGGRIYLAKDACIDAAQFQRMYPKLSEFMAVINTIDPSGRMQSDMSRRLLAGRIGKAT